MLSTGYYLHLHIMRPPQGPRVHEKNWAAMSTAWSRIGTGPWATFLLKQLAPQYQKEKVPVSPAHTVGNFPQLTTWQFFILMTFSISAIGHKSIHSVSNHYCKMSTNNFQYV